MNKLQKQLDSIVNSYYEELMKIDISEVKDHQFSERHHERMKEAFAILDKNSKRKPRSIRRRVIIALIVAALIGTITAVAYEPVRSFFSNMFTDHTEVRPANGSLLEDDRKEKIEKKYSVAVPSGYTLDEEASVEEDWSIKSVYYNSDRSKRIDFSQHVRSSYKTYFDNELVELETKLDEHGQEILVHSYNDTAVTIVWDNGEYIFELDANMSEAELMDIYYSIK